MRQFYLGILSFVLMFKLSLDLEAAEIRLFKNIKYGYELSYPIDWAVDTNENTVNPYRETPPDEARNLTFFNKSKSGAEVENWINLDVAPFKPFSADADKTYEESVKVVREMKQNRQKDYETRTAEFKINGNRFEISAQGKKSEGEYKLHSFLFCEKSKLIFGFFTTRNHDPSYNVISDLVGPIALEKIYTPEQLAIIQSFRCPDKNFKYKKTTPKIKKK